MDMSNYVQPNCINGVSKEDAEKVKEIPQIQEDILDLDDRVTVLENTPSGVPIFHRITTGERVSNKDRIIYFNLYTEYFGIEQEMKVYSIFIPAGIDIWFGDFPITITTNYKFAKDSATNVYGLNSLTTHFIYAIETTTINVGIKTIRTSGSGSTNTQLYTITDDIPKNLGMFQCCIYERE